MNTEADDFVTVAGHHAKLAIGVKLRIRKVKQTFANRPTPSGLPWHDLVAATPISLRRVFREVSLVTESKR